MTSIVPWNKGRSIRRDALRRYKRIVDAATEMQKLVLRRKAYAMFLLAEKNSEESMP